MAKRSDDGDKIISALRESYKKRTDKKNWSITLPGKVKFFWNGSEIKIHLDKNSVCENMQKDVAAFDSWALAFKNWLVEVDEVILTWDKPDSTDDMDYQKFLFRVAKVREVFHWFKVDKKCEDLLMDSKIQQGGAYFVNEPDSESKECAVKGEARYERLFINEYTETLADSVNMDNNMFFNQLPVGLFKDSVCDDSKIFEGFLDIWGINISTGCLNIFELKKPDNYPVGILSELFFYAMFEKSIIEKFINYEEKLRDKSHRGNKYLLYCRPEKIKAHFLTSTLHPLIDAEMIKLVNSALNKYNIEFDYLMYSIDPDDPFKITGCQKIF